MGPLDWSNLTQLTARPLPALPDSYTFGDPVRTITWIKWLTPVAHAWREGHSHATGGEGVQQVEVAAVELVGSPHSNTQRQHSRARGGRRLWCMHEQGRRG